MCVFLRGVVFVQIVLFSKFNIVCVFLYLFDVLINPGGFINIKKISENRSKTNCSIVQEKLRKTETPSKHVDCGGS